MNHRLYTNCLLWSGLVISGLGLCGFIPGSWICDLLSQFKLVYIILLLVILVLSAAARSRALSGVICACLLITSIPVERMFVRPRARLQAENQTIRILNFNSECQTNTRYDLLISLIESSKPDFIAIVEVNKKWIDAIESATKPYPYREVVLKGPGMAVFSKYPIELTDVRYFENHPRIQLQIRTDTETLHLLIGHPPTPSTPFRFEQRNREFRLLNDQLLQMPAPKMLIGDMNCGPWSPAFRMFLKSGLHDSEQGFGPQPSWPARTGRVIPFVPIPPLIPIDHILVSDDLFVSQRVTGPPMNSDHLPVIVDIGLATGATHD
jgi:endonuclease/exonuclease/phosphatase (EEP) superfamily protein YafD